MGAMLWAPPPKYAAESARSTCGRDAEQEELRRKPSTAALLATSGPNSARNSARRVGGEGLFPQRLFGNSAHISPVLDSDGSRAGAEPSSRARTSDDRSRGGDEPRAPKLSHQHSMGRLTLSELQATVAVEASPLSGERSPPASFASSSPRVAPARQDRAPASSPSASPGAAASREGHASQIHQRSRSLWTPNLAAFISPKDADIMGRWCTAVEGPLSAAFPDARCPYVWLDPVTQGPDLGVFDDLRKPWTFAEFKQELDYQDASHFDEWMQARCMKLTARADYDEEDQRKPLNSEPADKRCEFDDMSQSLPVFAVPTPSRAAPTLRG